MKKIILLLTLFTFCLGYSQFNSDSPWMQELIFKRKSSAGDKPLKFQEIVDAFNDYWKDKDYTKKGVGYKPFKRWENYWKHFVKEDGTLPTSYEIYNLWLQKQVSGNIMADESNWESMGPYNHTINGSWSSGRGRINVITVDPNDANTYYVGAPSGGIWKSIDAGTTWVPLSDMILQIGVSAIAIDPTDSKIIYIGTGDDDLGDTYSIGILKSIDGGLTWNNTGLVFNEITSNINEIYIDPNNNETIFVSSNVGFYKSTDAGVNFTKTLDENLKDVKLKPTDSNIIYAATSSQVYTSTDNGDNFVLSSTGLPSSGGRIALAVTPAAPENIYVLSASQEYFDFQGVFRSNDNGNNFERIDNGVDIFDGTSQAWYDLGFAVSDTNENEIYVGTVDVFKSIDGGASFTKWNSWFEPTSPNYTHADIHMIRFFNGMLFFATDGGIYKSTNGTSTIDLTNDLAIGQFYRISVSSQTSANMVGGLQDNGGYAYSYTNWKNYYGADGMDTAIDPNDPNKYYGFIQNGAILYFSEDAGVSLKKGIPSPIANGNWITPLRMNKESELYAAYDRVYKLNGDTFLPISDLATSFGQPSINIIEIDPTDSNIMYASIKNKLYKSVNRGINFALAETFSEDINAITVNSLSNKIVYVITSTDVFKSLDQTIAFENITFNLPEMDPKLVIKHQGEHRNNPVYLGTSLGVYRLDDTKDMWEPFFKNLPNVAIRDLEINLVDANITAATYGRGVWRTDIPKDLVDTDVNLISIDVKENQIFCESFSPSFKIKNSGINTINSIDISYYIDNKPPNNMEWTGNLSSDAIIDITLPTEVDVSFGAHKLTIEVSTPNDIIVANNKGMVNFLRNKKGNTQEVNTFETNEDNLLILGDQVWKRGVPNGATLNTSVSGTQVYGTDLDAIYEQSKVSYLISNCYDLTTISNPILKFYMAFSLDFEINVDVSDFLNIEYTTDNGKNWNVLGTADDSNWYNTDTPPNDDDCYLCPGYQWQYEDLVMKEYSYNLSSFINESNFIFRFNFVSHPTLFGEKFSDGVIIDDLVIEGETTLSSDEFQNNTDLIVYPNPSKNIFTILWKNAGKVSYDVFDITGKVVYSENKINLTKKTSKIDLSNYAKGVYFLKISSGDAEENIKLIKK